MKTRAGHERAGTRDSGTDTGTADRAASVTGLTWALATPSYPEDGFAQVHQGGRTARPECTPEAEG